MVGFRFSMGSIIFFEDCRSWGCGEGWAVSEWGLGPWPFFQTVDGSFGGVPPGYSLSPLVCGVGLSPQGRDWSKGGKLVGGILKGVSPIASSLPCGIIRSSSFGAGKCWGK